MSKSGKKMDKCGFSNEKYSSEMKGGEMSESVGKELERDIVESKREKKEFKEFSENLELQ